MPWHKQHLPLLFLLVSPQQQANFPSAASWAIVFCRCFVDLSIACAQFMSILIAQLSAVWRRSSSPWDAFEHGSPVWVSAVHAQMIEKVHGRFTATFQQIQILTEFLWIQNADQCRNTNGWGRCFSISFQAPGVSLRTGWSNATGSSCQQGTRSHHQPHHQHFPGAGFCFILSNKASLFHNLPFQIPLMFSWQTTSFPFTFHIRYSD